MNLSKSVNKFKVAGSGWSLILLALLSCGHQDEATVLRLAHELSVDHSVHQAMVYMADHLERVSEGQLEMKIYPSGQLGSERECLEMLQFGSLAMTKVSAAVMEGFSEKYKVLGLPYLFKSKAHAFQVLDGDIGREILRSGEEFWLRGLGFYDSGYRSFYTKDRPINAPADLEGMKIRVMPSNTAINMIRAMGGSPTPIAWGELYTALQSGVVDAAENNPPSFYLSHHYEVCKYYSIDEHTQVPDVLLISQVIWDKLSEQERQWVQEAANASVKHQRVLWEVSEQEAMEAVQAAGVEINYPDKSPFQKDVQSVYKSFQNNKTIYSLIQRIKAAS